MVLDDMIASTVPLDADAGRQANVNRLFHGVFIEDMPGRAHSRRDYRC